LGKGVISISVIIFILMAGGFGGALTKYDFLELVNTTHGCLKNCYTIYRLKNPTDQNLTYWAENFTTFSVLRSNLKHVNVTYLARRTCTRTVQNCTTENITYENGTNATIRNCTPVTVTYPCNKWVPLEYVYGDHNLVLPGGGLLVKVSGELERQGIVDNVITYAGYTYEEYAWWDANFPYCFPINLSATPSNSPQNIQVRLNLSYSDDLNSRCQSDFDDIRFVNSTNTPSENFPYYVETYENGKWVQVWVLVHDDVTTTNQTMLYVCCGNPTATSESSGEDVFNRFDDFEGESPNATVWDEDATDGTANTSYAYHGSQSWEFNTSGTQILESTFMEAGYGAGAWFRVYSDETNYAFLRLSDSSFLEAAASGLINSGKVQYYDGSWHTLYSSPSLNTWYYLETRTVDSTTVNYSVYSENMTLLGEATMVSTYNGRKIATTRLGSFSEGVFVDVYRVFRVFNGEISYSVGNEISMPITTQEWELNVNESYSPPEPNAYTDYFNVSTLAETSSTSSALSLVILQTNASGILKNYTVFNSTPLVLRWKLDEDNTTIHDGSDNQITATLFDDEGDAFTTNCVWGNCTSFDGVNDYLRSDTYPSYSPDKLTVALWVKLNTSDFGWIASHWQDNQNGWLLIYPSANKIRWKTAKDGTVYIYDFSTTLNNKWTHIVIIWKNSLRKAYLYINGSFIATTEGMGPLEIPTSNYTKLAVSLNATIDDFWLINRALNVYEIRMLMNHNYSLGVSVDSPITALNRFYYNVSGYNASWVKGNWSYYHFTRAKIESVQATSGTVYEGEKMKDNVSVVASPFYDHFKVKLTTNNSVTVYSSDWLSNSITTKKVYNPEGNFYGNHSDSQWVNRSYYTVLVENNATWLNYTWNVTEVLNGSSSEQTNENENVTRKQYWSWYVTGFSIAETDAIEKTNVTATLSYHDTDASGFEKDFYVKFNTTSNITDLPQFASPYTFNLTLPECNSSFNETVNVSGVMNISNTDYGQSFEREKNDSIKNYRIKLTDCTDEPSITATAINVTVKKESDRSYIDANLSSYWNVWVTGYDYKRFFIFTEKNSKNFTYCIYPAWASYVTDAELHASADGYTTRYDYLYHYDLDNSSEEHSIYLLSTSEDVLYSTIYVTYQDGTPATGIYIKVEKYYPDIQAYTQLYTLKTDSEGKTSGSFVNRDYYGFTFQSGTTVIDTRKPYLVDSDLITFTIGGTAISWNYDKGIAHTCTYNSTSHVVSCTLTDTQGRMRWAVFEVYFEGVASREKCYENNQTGATITFVYDLDNCKAGFSPENATYSYVVYGDVRGDPAWEKGIIGGLRRTFAGLGEGTVGTLAIFLGLVGVGMWNPPVAVVLGAVSLIVSGGLGLINVSWGAICGLLASIGLWILAMRRG